MIFTRSPLRITLGGGGTDLPSFYESEGGFLIAGAINKYVFVTVLRPFAEGVYLKYSGIENVSSINEIQHPIIRESLKLFNLKTPQIEITTLADIPSGTGLGSSGSFTTALLKSMHAHLRKNITTSELAELACNIEMDKLKEPVGKQDQYIAAYGGLTCFTFNSDGTVIVEPLAISSNAIYQLEEDLLLFYTGVSRSASAILKDQDTKSKVADREMFENLRFIKEIGLASRASLEADDLEGFGKLMDEHWKYKRSRSSGISNSNIDQIYSEALRNGAIGGKVVGAGGGGFLMFYAKDKIKLRKLMSDYKLEEVRFRFDFEGTKVILT
jgi:D-glycero-alpha-D-manno-heptose-7-phosphate kinase